MMGKLKRLCPGKSGNLSAVRGKDGVIHTDRQDEAAALTGHWKEVFSKKDVDCDFARKWMQEKKETVHSMHSLLPGEHDVGWKVTRKHVARAIKIAGNSAPGPDGIPFEVWRKLGPLGSSIIHRVLLSSMEEGAEARFDEARNIHGDLGDYNLATMVFLPKKPSGRAEDKDFYDVSATRPPIHCQRRQQDCGVGYEAGMGAHARDSHLQRAARLSERQVYP